MGLEYSLKMATAVAPQQAYKLFAELTGEPSVAQGPPPEGPWLNGGQGLSFNVSGPRHSKVFEDTYGFQSKFSIYFDCISDGKGGDIPYAASHRQMMKIVFALLEVIKGDAVLEEDEAPSTVLQRLGGVLTINRYWFDEFREYGIEPPAGLAYRVAELPKL